MWPVERLLQAKMAVGRNCTGVFAFARTAYLLSLVVRLGTAVAVICGILHGFGEHKRMWEQNEAKLMRPHAEPWHPQTLPLDINPVVYPVAKVGRKGSLPGRSGGT